MDFDLVIRGGTIVDGTGRPGVRGDVGIRDGRIVAVGEAKGAAAQTVDAGGLVVAPGFIDVHTHYDAQVMWDRMLTISPWHGVTTVVMGNCGFGVAPTRPDHRGLIMRTLEKVEGMSLAALEAGLGEKWPFETFPEYLDAVERRGTALNVAVLLGHTPLRLYVMGEEATERPDAGACARGQRRGRDRLRDLEGCHPHRLRRQAGAEPGRPVRRDRGAGRGAGRRGTGHRPGHRRPGPVLQGVREPRPVHRPAGDVDRAP